MCVRGCSCLQSSPATKTNFIWRRHSPCWISNSKMGKNALVPTQGSLIMKQFFRLTNVCCPRDMDSGQNANRFSFWAFCLHFFVQLRGQMLTTWSEKVGLLATNKNLTSLKKRFLASSTAARWQTSRLGLISGKELQVIALTSLFNWAWHDFGGAVNLRRTQVHLRRIHIESRTDHPELKCYIQLRIASHLKEKVSNWKGKAS